MGFVNGYKRKIARFIRREKADERGHIFARSNFPVLVLLRRTRFAAHFVTFFVSLFAAAFGYYAFQHFGEQARSFLAYHFVLEHGFKLLHRSVGRKYSARYAGNVIITAVDRRSNGARKLKLGNRHSLTEAYAGKVAVSYKRLRQKHSHRLAGKIYARNVAETERRKIVVKRILAERKRDIGKARVTAVVQRLRKRLVGMFAVFVVGPAFYGSSVYRTRAAGIENIARRKCRAVAL